MANLKSNQGPLSYQDSGSLKMWFLSLNKKDPGRTNLQGDFL